MSLQLRVLGLTSLLCRRTSSSRSCTSSVQAARTRLLSANRNEPFSRSFLCRRRLTSSSVSAAADDQLGKDGRERVRARPKAVIFDLGGVVASSPWPVFNSFESECELEPGSLVKTIKETGDQGSFARMERGELSTEAFCEPFAEEYTKVTGVKLTAEQVAQFMKKMGGELTMNPVALAMIDWLQERGIKTALLTNNFRREDGSRVLPQEKLNVDVVVESSLEGLRKPDKAIYDLTLKRLGVSADEAVFLDDLGGNLKAARDMGMHTIKVTDVTGAMKALESVIQGGNNSSGDSIPGTSEVSTKLKFPVEPFVHYLREKHGLYQKDPPVIRQFQHGQSNPTYYIAYGGAEMVLRKKPPGKLLPSAHAVEREFRVMKATQEAGVPIPTMLSLCEDENVIGTPFYLMAYIPGRILKDPSLPGMSSRERSEVYSEMVKVLAAIHRVDLKKANLEDFGKHGNYVSRQISRWSKQYEASKTHEIPSMDHLKDWLPAQAPTSDRTTIVHGDFRLDNLIFSHDRPEVLAVLDWELSTLGDPISDLAYCCMPYHLHPDQPQLKGLQGRDLHSLGIPTEEELITHYCQLTNTPQIANWDFYLAFTFFRIASILQGVYKRSLQQQSSSENARAVGLMAEGFAKKGWAFAQQQSQTGGRPVGTRAYSTHARVNSSTEDDVPISLMTSDFASFPPRLVEMREKLLAFMEEHIVPAESVFSEHWQSHDRWKPHPLIEDLKSKAQDQGLWNLFLPRETDPEIHYGAGLSNLEYAHLAEIMGRYTFSSEAFNCSAPDTGNMEVLVKYGTEEQKREWLEPLLAGKIRSCFAMTEPAVASSDATNIQSSIVRDGDSYILNGRKWWISGAVDQRCKICIFMGKTDPQAPAHKQQSMILVPMDTPGVKVLRPLTVFGYDDAPSGHGEMEFTDVRVPRENLLLGEGRGFEIAQGRLGPGRIHHCMRLVGMAERALDLMKCRVKERVAFGKPLAEQGTIVADIAHSRMEIEQARLLTLKAAHLMDSIGNKGARKEIAMIKVAAPMMAQRVVDKAMQAHGAMGLSGDRPLAGFFSWARILRLADGPDEVHTAAIGKAELRGR